MSAKVRRPSHPLDLVGHAMAAAQELIEAIYWLRSDGPMEAASIAWDARRCLLHLEPANVEDDMVRLRLFKFREAVRDAARGPSIRWKAEPIESSLAELRQPTDSSTPVSTSDSNSEGQAQQAQVHPKKELEDRFDQAYRSYKFAEHHFDRTPTDREAYDWLKEHGPEEYRLPSYFATWRRYVREGREYYGDQKNSPRAGRTGRSIVSPNDLDATLDE